MTRSRTDPDLPGRCRRCYIKDEHCICARLERTDNQCEVVFVRHHWEAHKSTNTVRIAELVLERSRLIEFGDEPGRADAELAVLSDTCLLYPGAPPTTLPGRVRLVVLDGTWAQTRRMLRRLPALGAMPRLSLPASSAPAASLRRSHLPGGRSTIEAVADALALLEGEAVAEALRDAARLQLEGVLRVRGKLPARKSVAAARLSSASTGRRGPP